MQQQHSSSMQQQHAAAATRAATTSATAVTTSATAEAGECKGGPVPTQRASREVRLADEGSNFQQQLPAATSSSNFPCGTPKPHPHVHSGLAIDMEAPHQAHATDTWMTHKVPTWAANSPRALAPRNPA
jgi:hypothetical protein